MLDIKAMAAEAGIDDSAPLTPYMLQRLEVLVKNVARECAGICAKHQEGGIGGWKHNTPQDCEIAIKARFGLDG